MNRSITRLQPRLVRARVARGRFQSTVHAPVRPVDPAHGFNPHSLDLWPKTTPLPSPKTLIQDKCTEYLSIDVPEQYLTLIHQPSAEFSGSSELLQIVQSSGCVGLRVVRKKRGLQIEFVGPNETSVAIAVASLARLLLLYKANLACIKLPFYVKDPRTLEACGLSHRTEAISQALQVSTLLDQFPGVGFYTMTHRLDTDHEYQVYVFLREKAAQQPVVEFLEKFVAQFHLVHDNVPVTKELYKHLYENHTALDMIERELGVIIGRGDIRTLYSEREVKSFAVACKENLMNQRTETIEGFEKLPKSDDRAPAGFLPGNIDTMISPPPLQKARDTITKLVVRFHSQKKHIPITPRVQQYLRQSQQVRTELLSNPEIYLNVDVNLTRLTPTATLHFTGAEDAWIHVLADVEQFLSLVEASLVTIPLTRQKVAKIREVFPEFFSEVTTFSSGLNGGSACYFDTVNCEIVVDNGDRLVAEGVKVRIVQQLTHIMKDCETVKVPYREIWLLRKGVLQKMATKYNCFAKIRREYIDDNGDTEIWVRPLGETSGVAQLKEAIFERVSSPETVFCEVVRFDYRLFMILHSMGLEKAYWYKYMPESHYFPVDYLTESREYLNFRKDLRRFGLAQLQKSPREVAYCLMGETPEEASRLRQKFEIRVKLFLRNLSLVKVPNWMLEDVLGEGDDAIRPKENSPHHKYSTMIHVVPEYSGTGSDVLVTDLDLTRRKETVEELCKRVAIYQAMCGFPVWEENRNRLSVIKTWRY
ncbi:hypothetical protein BABINDRAFT_10107 [Babjeviella inositovora NRRL Y-12698]|uniref:Uncharacterized protein n=1 Tax=Babjeviella inositovora NRRL Y-12698 TaxID=984486 RepID=A0A1E3QID7_9ASCO|nr:uncharacterized protein BABINDRAFT_10107 [Babjeviella inositovora NRRL Y-12698]ODQ77466.1 hypothetical protein BABINDRAFT_10107 [Babjeviella inositovora NRRL Y-12698]